MVESRPMVSGLVGSVAEDDVRILVDFNRIFHHNADPRVHLPVREFPDVLGIPRNRSGPVSDEQRLIIALFVNLRDP